MHLLQKRIMYLNSDDALTDSNDTRGDLWIPVPQQLPDPSATDLVFKMYIQDAIIVNDNVNINASNAQFSMTVFLNTPYTVTTGGVTVPEQEQLFNRTYTFPSVQMSEIDFVEMWNAVFGQFITPYSNVLAAHGKNTNYPSVLHTLGFDSFQLEWTAAAYENDRFNNGYRPAIERDAKAEAAAGANPPDPNRVQDFPPFMPLGDRLMCIVRNVEMSDPFAGNGGNLGNRIAWLANHLSVKIEALNPAGGKLLGMQQDQSGPASIRNLTPFWAAQYPSPTRVPGDFLGPADEPTGDSYASDPGQAGKMFNENTNKYESYPSYETARAAAAMPFEMLMDDFTQLHINTDLPVQNSEVRQTEGLSQSRITALVPVGVPHGGTVYYSDLQGVNAAYERNQSTLSRLHIWLTDKYGKAYNPASPWTFSFALEIWQDDFKRMLDVLLGSQSLHESTVKLHKLGLVGASFQALE
jgi:hypothetical protein